MNSLLKLFKKELAKCNICDRKIYSGDYYGFEHDQSSLSITGYFDYHFCKNCIEKNCVSSPLNEQSVGKTYIIWRRNGERSRITIRR